MDTKIVPIILAGGAGTRLWPLSKESCPKQFLKLTGPHSLFQKTLLRTKEIANIRDSIVVVSEAHYFTCRDQLQEIGGQKIQMILEPCSRNTAPAIACAAHLVRKLWGSSANMIVLPTDHMIEEESKLSQALTSANKLDEGEHLTTFGISPTSPHTGYGYIQAASPINAVSYRVEKFTEKPTAALAKTFLAAKNYYWNSGIFFFRATTYLAELNKYAPSIFSLSELACREGEEGDSFIRVAKKYFSECPNTSIDYAVMEKTDRGAVIPLNLSWSDLGCWASVATHAEGNTEKNTVLKDCKGCFVTSEGKRIVAALGVENLVIISTDEAVLVTEKGRSQEVKKLVEEISALEEVVLR